MVIKSPTFQSWDTILNMEINSWSDLFILTLLHDIPPPSMWSHWRCWSNGSVLLTTGNYCRWIKECQHPFRRNLRNLFPSPRSDSPAFPSAIQAQEQSDKLKCLECSRTHSVQLTSRSEMIAGTELARVLKELEQEYNSREENKHQHHHDEA